MQHVVLAGETDWEGWRRATRAFVLAGVPPEEIAWRPGGGIGDPLPDTAGGFNLSRALVALAETAILAREPTRFDLLYRLVWRTHRGERRLMEQPDDAEVQRAAGLGRAVRQDAHRMRASLRFREVAGANGAQYVAWYEPAHHVLEAVARFLTGRIGAFCWSILTPEASAHWGGASLMIGPGTDPAGIFDDTALEQLWRRSFFRPGGEWRNSAAPGALPELVRETLQTTEELSGQEMRAPEDMPLGPVRLRSRESGPAAPNTPLGHAALDAETCRRCDLWKPATQTVFGEGPAGARIMFVGEQPGDQEDLVGRPFVGPAGRLLDRALEEAGIDRRSVYVTNAVKHFKFVPRGKRRIHQKPDTPEIVACKFWLDIELREVDPDLVVLLGATAARAVLGRPVTIGRERGERIELGEGRAAFVTVHPSFLLRVPDEASKAREYRAFVADLTKAARIAAAIERAR